MSKQKGKRNLLKMWVNAQISEYGNSASHFLYAIFITGLVLIFIWNGHSTEMLIIENNSLNAELQEYVWEYTSLKAELNHKSKQSEVASQVQEIGLEEIRFPPNKILVNGSEY